MSLFLSVIFSVLFSTRRLIKIRNTHKPQQPQNKNESKPPKKTKNKEKEILNEMLTLDTLCLFKAYRINQSRAHSPEQNSRHRFLKQNKSSTLLLYYLTVIIIKSSSLLLLLLLLVPFVRFQSLCQCYKTSSSTEHNCKGKNV